MSDIDLPGANVVAHVVGILQGDGLQERVILSVKNIAGTLFAVPDEDPGEDAHRRDCLEQVARDRRPPVQRERGLDQNP